MPILHVLLILCVIGFLIYAEERWVPMSPGWHLCIRVVAIILTALWLLNMVVPLNGLLTSGPRLGRH